MTVSVVIPAYNRAALLPRAIRSVEAQTFVDWELIVVDDGSTDNTRDVVPPGVRYLRQENAGVGAARNAGIAIAHGEYISLLDSDDEYLPEHLGGRLAILKKEGLDLVAGGFSAPGASKVVDFYDPTKLIDLEECVVGGSLFGRREVFLQGFNDANYGEDTDFWERAQRRFKTQFIREPKTYILHETPGSLRLNRLSQFEEK